jgi:hypothetical protein
LGRHPLSGCVGGPCLAKYEAPLRRTCCGQSQCRRRLARRSPKPRMQWPGLQQARRTPRQQARKAGPQRGPWDTARSALLHYACMCSESDRRGTRCTPRC